MQNLKKQMLALALMCSFANANEPSIFDAGNLDVKTPYGLTNTEKNILKNRQEIDSVDTKIKTIKDKTDEIKTTVEGLAAIASSNSDHVSAMSAKINDLSKQLELKNNEITALKKSIADLKYLLAKNTKTQEDESALLKKLISDLGSAVSEINKNYVSSNEFKANLEQLATKKTEKVVEVQKKETPQVEEKVAKEKVKEKEQAQPQETKKTSQYNGKKSQEIFTLAKKFYDKKSYDDSKEGFEQLVKKNFKPAESNYYLGLISVDEKSYEDAIEYFRKSALLNEEARYMPNLLLKSAEAFEKSGNKSNAKKFYKALTESYPDSKEAAVAKTKLSKLK